MQVVAVLTTQHSASRGFQSALSNALPALLSNGLASKTDSRLHALCAKAADALAVTSPGRASRLRAGATAVGRQPLAGGAFLF